MRIFEFNSTATITEAQIDPSIKKILTTKGYKFLGKGNDQDAYIAPDGTILKIFGYEPGTEGFTRGQKSFIDFANYCMKNSNNKFLPQFYGWETFMFDGKQYLQIKSERLFDIEKSKMNIVGNTLEYLAEIVDRHGALLGFKEFMNDFIDNPTWKGNTKPAQILISLLGGEEEVKLFCKTIEDLDTLADKKGYFFDLHKKNFMLGSDGEIVINDPFFSGSFRVR